MRNNKPTVSAIITTHNRKELLQKAIDSVLKQTYSNIECIVVDDAGTDDTKEYIKEYIDNNKITYIYIPKEKSLGGNHARNVGIKQSTGNYIAFLDDDDEWADNKIELQIKEITDTAKFIYSGVIIEKNFKETYDDSLKRVYPEGDLSREILIHILTVTSTILVDKNILLEVGMFDEQLKYWQEYDLCIRILQKTKAKCIKKGLVLYRVIDKDKKRLSNNISGWEESVKYISNKYKNNINTLSNKEKAKRELYICIDGYNRGKKAKSYKHILKYGFIYPVTHPRIIIEFSKKITDYAKRKIQKKKSS